MGRRPSATGSFAAQQRIGGWAPPTGHSPAAHRRRTQLAHRCRAPLRVWLSPGLSGFSLPGCPELIARGGGAVINDVGDRRGLAAGPGGIGEVIGHPSRGGRGVQPLKVARRTAPPGPRPCPRSAFEKFCGGQRLPSIGELLGAGGVLLGAVEAATVLLRGLRQRRRM